MAAIIKSRKSLCLQTLADKGNNLPNSPRQHFALALRFSAAFLLISTTLITFLQLPGYSTASKLPFALNEDTYTSLAEDDTDELAAASSLEDTEAVLTDLYMFAKASLEHQLRKRHISRQSSLEWDRPCGSTEVPSSIEKHPSAAIVCIYLRDLRHSIRQEYKNMHVQLSTTDISKDNMKKWRLHKRNYEFLPQLKHNASISPMCWHHDMQKYVASFAFLNAMQREWDRHKLQAESEVSKTLSIMLNNGKDILCKIESAVIGAYPHDKRRFSTYTQMEMTEMLGFYTRSISKVLEHGVDERDLLFVKRYYLNYLFAMFKALPHRGCDAQHLVYECNAHSAPSSTKLDISENLIMQGTEESEDVSV